MGEWSQQTYVKASDTSGSSYFGISLALSNDTLAVGASGEGSSYGSFSGTVYVFTRDIGNTWSQQAYIKASNGNEFDEFGVSVSLFGDTLAIGANNESSNAIGIDGSQSDNTATSSGAVYVFDRDVLGSWNQQVYIKASNTGNSDSFGINIGLSNIGLAVGADLEGSIAVGINGDEGDDANATGAGAVYLFSTPQKVFFLK